MLDFPLLLARTAERPEEPALGGEHGVGDEGPDLEQPGDAALGKLFLRLARVVRAALDDKPAHPLGPGQGHVLRDVEEIAAVAREHDVLLIHGQPRLGQVRGAEARELGEPRQHSAGDGLEVRAIRRRLGEQLAGAWTFDIPGHQSLSAFSSGSAYQRTRSPTRLRSRHLPVLGSSSIVFQSRARRSWIVFEASPARPYESMLATQRSIVDLAVRQRPQSRAQISAMKSASIPE